MPLLPLIATVIPLGIAAAIHPTLIALQLLLVSEPHWWPRARALTIGAALPLVIFGALVYFGFAQLPEWKPGELDFLGFGLRAIIGVGFLAAATWLLRAHPNLQQRSTQFVESKVTSGAPRDFFIIGVVMNGKSVTSYALLLPALHDISTDNESIPVTATALAILYGLALSALWVPMLLAATMGQRGSDRLQRMSTFVIDNDLRILGFMALGVGLYLTGSAAVLLADLGHS